MSDPGMNYLNMLIDSSLERSLNLAQAERATQPPEPDARAVADDEKLRAQAAATIDADAQHRDHWRELFDDVHLDHVNLSGLADAMHAAHIGDEAGALRALREAVQATHLALVHEEHEELRQEAA